MKHKLCKHCFIPIYKDTRTGYCTKYCQQLAERDPCPVCGKRLLTDSKTQVYCSRECLSESLKKEKPVHVCENCGKEFARFPNTKDSCRFCSRDCGVEFVKKDFKNAPAYVDGSSLRVNGHRIGSACSINYRRCRQCQKTFVSNSSIARICSEDCRVLDANRSIYFRSMVKYYKNTKPVSCLICGKRFVALYGDKRKGLCSDACVKTRAKDYQHERRMLVEGSFVESVSIEYLYFRDYGKCQICGKKLNLKRKVPDKLAATIDHIIPISKGGEHSKRNTQLVCFRCNSVKGNRHGGSGDQLLLFG